MTRTVAQKLGIREHMEAVLVNAPASAAILIPVPTADSVLALNGAFDYIHFFANSQAELQETFPKLKYHLERTGMFWVSWPKGGQRKTDLSLPAVIRIGYGFGLVESKCISVDSVWSALKFTHPIPGKTYKNRFGALELDVSE